ncbi:hypothetical protein GYMLUDRAFT_86435 [Collybiopsis luxurians FD-317 M1]|uniref:Nephrocystin 3-like N-terminal domain-containing protein n=1 Tax=Collybiopsis luxurians FD-317 M1 TaxID=944289 RepID=A0A0D0CR86_9AGAR|nr:hypothetical protein GYMLUDRAFT_86435 [Collybiopsis luxurians FD-317 M1]
MNETENFPGLLKLYSHTSRSASYNAASRFSLSKFCNTDIQKDILVDLKSWAREELELDEPRLHLLYGPAEAGKSILAQTLAEKCAKTGNLAGTFFFSQFDSTRNTTQRLFTTIAFQMASSIPGLRSIIDAAVVKNPTVPTSSVQMQFKELILQPWIKVLKDTGSNVVSEYIELGDSRKRCQPQTARYYPSKRRKISEDSFVSSLPLSETPRIIILDGLDECSDSTEHEHVFSILSDVIQNHGLPLRVLITSRPEPHIELALKTSPIGKICRWIPLDDTYKASCDIRKLMHRRFNEIFKRRSSSMQGIPHSWPSSEQIEELVRRARGNITYLTTLMRFINDENAKPSDRLNLVLESTPPDVEDSSSSAGLDALYRQILSLQKEVSLLRKVLGALITQDALDGYVEQRWGLNRVAFVADVFKIPLSSVCEALSGLRCLFRDGSPFESEFCFRDKSFVEFLLDSKRSQSYFIDAEDSHDSLAACCLDILNGSFSISSQAQDKVNPCYEYASDYWVYHCVNAKGSAELLAKLEAFDIYTAANEKVWGMFWWSFEPQTLANFLADVHQVWLRFKPNNSSGDSRLKHFSDISSGGFFLTLIEPDSDTRYTIRVSLTPKYYAQDIPISILENHLQSELASSPIRTALPYSMKTIVTPLKIGNPRYELVKINSQNPRIK